MLAGNESKLASCVIAALLVVVGNSGAPGQALPPIDDIQVESGATGEAPVSDANEPMVLVDQVAAKAFAPPPAAKRISKKSNLWIDPRKKRVYVDGYVAMDKGMLEMFGCPTGTKEHESVVGVLAKAKEVHTALLAVGAKPGTTVRYEPDFVPPTGQQIRIWVAWRDEHSKFHVEDAKNWIRNIKTKKPLSEDWVFAGSQIWKDPLDGKKYYQAEGGDMICVSNFSTAMLDVPFASSAQAQEGLLFEPMAKNVPPVDTPIRLIMIPIPIPTDRPTTKQDVEPDRPPTEEILPISKAAKQP